MSDLKPFPPAGAKTPKPLYSCHYECCAEEVSHDAEKLTWSNEVNGWVCDTCRDYNIDEPRGVTLADYLKTPSPGEKGVSDGK